MQAIVTTLHHIFLICAHGFVVVTIMNITEVKAAVFTNPENIVRLKIAKSMWHLLISFELLLSSRQEPAVVKRHMSIPLTI